MATTAKDRDRKVAAALLRRSPKTFAEQAGIVLTDTPSALYCLLVLATLLSARISSTVAVRAARELFEAGFRTPRAMAAADWQQRVDALGRGHYRRYDERTASMLGDGAELLVDRYRGDLRRLRAQARGTEDVENALQQFPGIGPTGASIFCREVQGVWPDLAPYLDGRATRGADRLGLPTAAERLAGLVDGRDLPRFAAALVAASLDRHVVQDVLAAVGETADQPVRR